MQASQSAPDKFVFTGYQKFIVAILAFLQFTVILDFMIISPLGAILMDVMKITTKQFGMVVSAYAFSAGISGLLAAGFADRFDRKKMLLFFYTGFILGTLACAVAPDYKFLMAARIVTGLFGGVIGSIVMAIATDLFPMQVRGRVMGIVQTAFAASQVLGIPIGLFLATHWGWHFAFMMIVLVGIAVGIVIVVRMQPIDAHLKLQTDIRAFTHLFTTVANPRYLMGFAATALLSTGGFMLMPFGSAFSVNNLGIDLEHLPMVYLITGICSMVAGPLIGRATDKYGKLKVFVIGSIWMILTVEYYTKLGITPISIVILVSIAMFIGVSARMVSSMALMSAVPAPQHRGAFMSVNASIQQVSGGIASIIAGLIVVQSTAGPLEHFDVLGYVVSGSVAVNIVMMYLIDRMIKKPAVPPTAPQPA